MGHITHKAIVVTATDDDITTLHARAVELCGDLVSPVVSSRVNGDASFFVATDGSKRGWKDAERGDAERGMLVEYLNTDPQKCYPQWVEIAYGHDDGAAQVTKSTWTPAGAQATL